MILIEYLKKHPLTKSGYRRDDVEKIRSHAFIAGKPVVKETRSDRQRKYQWGVVYKVVGDHTGYEPEEIHQIFGREFLSYENKGEKFVKSTTLLNTKEMEDYLEKCRRFASIELSCFVPLPNETEFAYEIK